MNSKANFEKRSRLVIEFAQTAILALLLFLTIRFAVQNFNIDGTSMEPNLHNSELVLVDKWTYLFHEPARGDVVIFRAPPDPTQDYVKRVIGKPGDMITVKGTEVIVDGVKLNETYIDSHNQGVPPEAHTITNEVVPTGEYFVLGDNRAVSSDSRIWGFVPRENIIGRAALVYWPLGQNNNGFLPSTASVFASIHTDNNQQRGPLSTVTANTLWLLMIPMLLLVYIGLKILKRRFIPSKEEHPEAQP